MFFTFLKKRKRNKNRDVLYRVFFNDKVLRDPFFFFLKKEKKIHIYQ
jgi:hypothetical protein